MSRRLPLGLNVEGRHVVAVFGADRLVLTAPRPVSFAGVREQLTKNTRRVEIDH